MLNSSCNGILNWEHQQNAHMRCPKISPAPEGHWRHWAVNQTLEDGGATKTGPSACDMEQEGTGPYCWLLTQEQVQAVNSKHGSSWQFCFYNTIKSKSPKSNPLELRTIRAYKYWLMHVPRSCFYLELLSNSCAYCRARSTYSNTCHPGPVLWHSG